MATDDEGAATTSAAASITVTSTSPPSGDELEAPNATMVVDADAGDWAGIPLEAITEYNVALPPPSSSADNSGVFAVAWDEDYLYVSAQITDDEYDVGGSSGIWNLDGIEVLIDGLNNKSTTFLADDHQIFVRADGVIQADGYTGGNAIMAAGTQTADGYYLEVAVSWAFVNGNAPQEGRVYGFDLAVNDRDNEDIEHQLMWKYAPYHYDDTSGWGEIILTGAGTPPTNQAPSVTLTSPSDGATFQAPADVTLTASASDADGSVAQVEFFAGTTLVATDTDGGDGWSATWPSVPAGSYTLTAVATDDEGAATTSAAATITVSDPAPGGQQSIALAEGWNLVSSYIAPPDASMEAIFADIGDNLEEVRDGVGGVYDPSESTNTIGDWDPLQAYLVSVQQPVTLTLEGEQLSPESNPIPLATGWNQVAYLWDESLPVEDVVASLGSDLVIVKDGAGKVYYPDFGINTLGMMVPGEGYKIFVAQQTTLVFPSNATPQTRVLGAAANPGARDAGAVSSSNQ